MLEYSRPLKVRPFRRPDDRNTLTKACTDAKSAPAAMGSDVAGVRNAKSGSPTDQLTREHRLTLDEAHLILNTQREDSMERILEVRRVHPSRLMMSNATL